MNYEPLPIESSASTSTIMGRGGSPRNNRRPTSLLSKFLVVAGITLGMIVVCGLTLRTSVMMLSEQSTSLTNVSAGSHGQSRAGKLSQRQRENERVRDDAHKADRELLQRRRDRLWREDSRSLPDKNDAYHRWYREVREIEDHLADAEKIQATLSPEAAQRGPLAEGTVLWHRKQRLKELRADAPRQ